MFRRVKSETENVVCNVFAYVERQAKKARVSSSPLIRTVKATGLSRATVTRIEREQSRLLEGVEFRDRSPRLLSLFLHKFVHCMKVSTCFRRYDVT